MCCFSLALIKGTYCCCFSKHSPVFMGLYVVRKQSIILTWCLFSHQCEETSLWFLSSDVNKPQGLSGTWDHVFPHQITFKSCVFKYLMFLTISHSKLGCSEFHYMEWTCISFKDVFLAKSNVAFLFSSLITTLHRVVNLLYFLVWSFLITMDLDLISLPPGECFSPGWILGVFTMERILW